MILSRIFPRRYNPSIYQGRKNPENYFEGWYFKLVDREGHHIWSVIPGVSYADDTHSFVQVIHANTGKTYYHRYPVEAFVYSNRSFQIQVGANHFSDQGLTLSLDGEGITMEGTLLFHDTHPFPVKPLAPGIMGWYTFVPFMECYHGVVSMQHRLQGNLTIDGSVITFDQGKGYMEKDWGKSMPSDWIWIQTNHFAQDQEASFMVSLARIPWLKGFFPGFLSFLLWQGKVYLFATYNRSSVDNLTVTEDQVKVRLKNRKYFLEVSALRSQGGVLKAPRHGAMDRDIKESIVSSLKVELKNRNGEVLFTDWGWHSGLEIVGDMTQYYKNID